MKDLDAIGVRATFDHAAHAAERIVDLLPLYRDQLGGRLLYGGPNVRVGYRGVVLEFDGGKVELLEPLPGSTFFDSFFARNPRGGLHHLTFRVHDLADAVARSEAAGLHVIGWNVDDPDWREAFIHPRSANGALVQFVQSRPGYPTPSPDGETVESLLAAQA
jgi:methylmalonyl-CoA/ethylmalonyl-CoA epimerase